jgi:uncharacterized protein (DUF2141 family)
LRLLLCFLALTLGAQAPATVKVTVRLLEVRPAKGGVLHVGVHPEPGTGFPGPSPLVNRDVSPAAPETILTFDLEPGTYAVAVHHDANANGKLDTNFLGIPKEGYGVSNDARPKLRAPQFDEAKLTITRDTTVTVRVVY